MIKILSAKFRFYRNEAHYEYMTVYNEKLMDHQTVLALVHPFVFDFNSLLDRERKLVDAQKKSPYTAQIVEADKLDDRLVLGIKETISGAMRHYEPEVAEAAIRLNDRLRTFGKIESKSYEEEAAAISILLADLQSPRYAADVTAVKIDGWIAQLAVAAANFKNLLRLRSDSIAETLPKENLRTIRRQIDAVYHKMTTRINAASTLDDDGVYEPFVRQLNAEIRYFNEHTHIHAKKDLGESDRTVIKSIETQPYTGEAVTPIPVAYYHEPGKPPAKLTFAEDFTITYKNNVKTGMAEVTLHGKGAYKGRKTTVFIIEKS
jgi:hypothetical protein